jgi:hypothetical protein
MLNSQLQPDQVDYRFYPSLLDSYRWYQSSEKEEAEQELLDKINRVPFSSELADKGTWFNDLIDLCIKGEEKHDLNYLTGCALDISERLYGSAKQVFTSTTIEVDGKVIELYGYIDYVLQDRVIDLKTTKAYELGKYQHSLQLHFYPVSLIDAGNEINQFEFMVTDFTNVFSEVYKVDYEASKRILADACRELIRFIEFKRHLITDKKIFNEQLELA